MDKQQIFADGIYVANNNFFNMAFYNYLNGLLYLRFSIV